MDTVVVSASRAEQRSFDTPAAVQSVDRSAIENGGAQVNLSESLVRVPGITILDRENFAQDLQVSIRGFGARSAFGIRGIRLLIDGIPATTPDGQGQASSVSLTSMDHIEVLRGPLAQMYGNSSGGVIQAFSRPASATPEFNYQAYTGSYDLRRSDYQLSDTVGIYELLADYAVFDTNGYRKNSAAERKQFNGSMRFNANEQLRINVVVNQFDMPLALDPLGLTARQLATDPSQAGTGALNYSTRKTVLQNQLGSSATYTLDADHSITTRVYDGTRDNLQYQSATVPSNGIFPTNGSWVGLNRKYYGLGLQYNARSTWNGLPIEWVSGYEFDRSREYRQGGATLAGQKSGSPNRDEDNQSENSDWFAQGRAMVSDALAITSGLRYSTVRFNSTDYYLGDNFDGSGDISYSAVSPVLGFTRFVTETLNVYANYGQGFETPTLAEMAYQTGTSRPVNPLFNTGLSAATSQHYEIGAKWVPNPQTRLDFTLYQINTWSEIVVAASSAGQTSYRNAPSTARFGYELSASNQLTRHLSATLSGSVIDARYTQKFNSGSNSVASGNFIPGIPATSVFSELAWSDNATAAYKGAPAMGSRVALEMQHAGRIYANDTNTDAADGHTVFNLAARQRWPVGKGTLELYARLNNLGGEKYVGSVIVNQTSQQYYEPGLPYNWTAGIRLSAPL